MHTSGTAPELPPEQAGQRLRAGAVVAYPTEGVWGLGCDPRSQQAVLRLLAIKQRPVDKGLILIAAGIEQLHPFIDLDALPPGRQAEVLAGWPGARTWIVPATPAAPAWITGIHAGIAVRVSDHAPVIALCTAFGGALVSTSANLAGQPAAHTQGELDPALLARIDAVVPGPTGGLSAPTPIRNALDGRILRD